MLFKRLSANRTRKYELGAQRFLKLAHKYSAVGQHQPRFSRVQALRATDCTTSDVKREMENKPDQGQMDRRLASMVSASPGSGSVMPSSSSTTYTLSSPGMGMGGA